MSDSKENNAAAASLAPYCHEKIVLINHLQQGLNEAGDQLILLNIDKEDKLVRYLDPATFAETLLKNGLPPSVESIIFLVSDINQDENLCTFSRFFIKRLEKEFAHPLAAYIPTNIYYASTLIEPPSKKSLNWQVLGIKEKPTQSKLDFSWFSPIKNKELLWEGADILAWMKTKGKVIHTLPDDIEKITFAL